MPAKEDTHEDRGSTALTVAAIGGGAVLLWLVLRGGRKGWTGLGSGGGKRGTGKGSDPDTSGAAETPIPRRYVTVWTRSGDRVDVDGITTDLATVVTLARAAGAAHLLSTGDARKGWLEKALGALMDSGVEVLDGTREPNRLYPAVDRTPSPRLPPNATADPATRIRAPNNPNIGSLRNARTFLTDVRDASETRFRITPKGTTHERHDRYPEASRSRPPAR